MRRERSQQIARLERRAHDPRTPPGILYVVGMPIGHRDDITIRALHILRHTDVIASENPRATQSLLTRHRIRTPVTSYGPSNLKEKVAILIHRLQRGAHISLVSDCGSPVISDPGCLLVQSAHSHGIRVLSVPGASALTAATAVSGLSGDSFFFQGRLPETRAALERCVTRLLECSEPTVVFATPESTQPFLTLLTRLAPRRTVIAACDLTRPGETVARGCPWEVQRMLAHLAPVRDVTLIIKGRSARRREA